MVLYGAAHVCFATVKPRAGARVNTQRNVTLVDYPLSQPSIDVGPPPPSNLIHHTVGVLLRSTVASMITRPTMPGVCGFVCAVVQYPPGERRESGAKSFPFLPTTRFPHFPPSRPTCARTNSTASTKNIPRAGTFLVFSVHRSAESRLLILPFFACTRPKIGTPHTHTCTGERNQLISLTRWPSVERVLGRRWYVGSLQFAAMQGLMQGEGGSPERGKNTD